MTREEAIALIEKLPSGTEIFVRHGITYDDAYTPQIKAYRHNGKVTAYIEVASQNREHRNYPKGYSGVEEVDVG